MNESSTSDPKRELLRHALATVAYRGGKAVRNAPERFAAFQAAGAARTPISILAHIGDLMDWGLSMANGERQWRESKPLPWSEEVERFFISLTRFDDFLASREQLQAPPERLFQGPLADALTHIGQIAILRRLAGEPVKSENYYKAEITVGRVGADQAKPKLEF
ncbi:MAG: hypothetical protein ACLQLC_03025 [Candidatus Sulfotelmatobacter sp.]